MNTNWKFWAFWERKREPKRETYDEWRARMDSEQAAKEAKAKAEWDALPDHRKAARIEYQHFQKMTRKPPARDALYNLALAQQQGFYSSGTVTIYPSPYAQMNSEIGRIICLESGGFKV